LRSDGGADIPAAPEPRARPTLTVGAPRVVSLVDLIEQMLRDPQPIVEREIGRQVHAGAVRFDRSGKPVPDLAESLVVSDDRAS